MLPHAKQMLIDRFKKTHGMKVGISMRCAIEDFVLKPFGKGQSSQLPRSQTSTPSSSSSIIAHIQDKVKTHIQGEIDGIGLADCIQSIEADVPLLGGLPIHTADLATTSIIRLDVPAFILIHRAQIPPSWDLHWASRIMQNTTIQKCINPDARPGRWFCLTTHRFTLESILE